MALTKLTENVNIIQSLSDRPNSIDGLTAAQLKERYDRAGAIIKDYLNTVLTEELDALLVNIPDTSNFVRNTDSRLNDSRKCNNTFDSWSSARNNLKITYGTTLPSSADNGSIFFLYK